MKFVLLIIILIGNTFQVAAEDPRVDEIMVSTPNYFSNLENFKPALGTYEYDVTWAGIPAATLWLKVKKIGLNYNVTTIAKSASGISIFYKLRYEANGLVSGVDFTPLQTVIEHRENSRYKKSVIEFGGNGDVHSNYFYKNREVKYDFNPENLMLDPFSSSFLALSLDWEPGTVRHFDTFNGRSRYLITLKSVDEVQMKINGHKRKVWVIEPKVKKLNSDDPNKSKLRNALIYITADQKRELVQIKSEVFIGNVYTKLVAFTPEPVVRASMAKNSDEPGKIEINF